MNRTDTPSGSTRPKRLAIGACVALCCALLIIQAVKGPTVIGCVFPVLGTVAGVFYLGTTRCGR